VKLVKDTRWLAVEPAAAPHNRVLQRNGWW